jgi:hypothetical protein
MAETTYREWKGAVMKRPNPKYKIWNQRREDMEKKFEMLPKLEYLKSIGHILMNVTDLVNEGSDNN